MPQKTNTTAIAPRNSVATMPEILSRMVCSMQLVSLGAEEMAERTGLEPATPGVTGRYSNQLNYRSALKLCDVRRRPAHRTGVVGAEGIEPPTFAL